MKLKDPKNQQLLNEFLIDHAPLISYHANKLKSENKIPSHIDTDDLHNAGFEGLLNAVHKYDPEVGVSLVTYAGPHIRNSMLAHVNESDPVHGSIRRIASNLKANEKIKEQLKNKPVEVKTEDPSMEDFKPEGIKID